MNDMDKRSALRFILSMPLHQWFGVSALPNYVWNYIYEVGTMIDVPWVMFIDDETGARIQRWQRTVKSEELADMVKGSLFFERLGMEALITLAVMEMISVTDFEIHILRTLKTMR